MKPFRVTARDAGSAIGALNHAGIANGYLQWGDVVYIAVESADAEKAQYALRPWLLLPWWERLWGWVTKE